MEMVTYRGYREYKTELDTELQKSAEGFVKIGYLLKLARDTEILRESGYNNVNDFAKAEYGIDKTMVSRFISINDRFSEGGNSPELKERYRGLGYAKLTIMLQLPDAINEEISPAFSKTEVQTIKEEYDEEKKKTDLEVLMERVPENEVEENNLTKAVRQIGHDNPEVYLEIHKAMKAKSIEDLQEALAPAGESIYSVRLPGVGRLMLSVKGTDRDVTLVNIRTSEKENYSWEALGNAVAKTTDMALSAKESWENVYEEEFPVKEEVKKTEVAPVQPKKEEKPKPKRIAKVTKAKETIKKTESKPETVTREKRENTEGQQDAAVVPKCDREPISEQEYEKRYWNYMDMIVANISSAQENIGKKAFGLARDGLKKTVELLDELVKLQNDCDYHGKED